LICLLTKINILLFALYFTLLYSDKKIIDKGIYLKRCSKNPIITREDIPAILPEILDVTSVFNPGAIKFKDKYLLLLRVQNRARETFLIKALSDDGLDFTIDNKIVEIEGIQKYPDKIYHIYDPRITFLDNLYYIMFAMDTDIGCQLGLAKTENFQRYDFMGVISNDSTRNGVLFPEKIDNKYYCLERPNLISHTNSTRSGDAIVVSISDDLISWKRTGSIIEGRWHYWDELIGSGTPPVKTKSGWLAIYHGVATHLSNVYIYQAGVVLLDLDSPSKVISRGKYNILEPREVYELTGQVPNVVFPTGIIVEKFDDNGFALNDSEVKIYYGAADTCVALAKATIDELIQHCFAGGEIA
jgi:beta-1,4-mannooligosaccharide/beta-1,4-mannosyl-N-acetylglucosamine phosphorylase